MKRVLIILVLVVLAGHSLLAQVKRQYEDKKQGKGNRTVVVKETGVDDYDILEKQFGDVEVGKVIRITMDKPPKEKIKKEPAPKKKVAKKTPPKPAVKDEPKPERSVVRSGGSSSPKVKKKRRSKRFKKTRRKRNSSRKKFITCYKF